MEFSVGTGYLAMPRALHVVVYYGGADTVVCLAFAYIDELVQFTKTHSINK
jgi:beta-1,4-mannooligosaccharide/beta-1,4-mannosyl-N-acetylglucosamine phosphorylase